MLWLAIPFHETEIKTHPGHHRDKKEHQAFPVPRHVCLGQLHANRENADSQDDTSELESYGVDCFFRRTAPVSGIEDVRAVWTCILD